MLSSAAPFDVVREHVEALMEVGEPFAAVERVIDSTPLPEDERAALWLLAWSLEGGGQTHRIAPAGPARRLSAVPPPADSYT
jgi:hypothetical protein